MRRSLLFAGLTLAAVAVAGLTAAQDAGKEPKDKTFSGPGATPIEESKKAAPKPIKPEVLPPDEAKPPPAELAKERAADKSPPKAEPGPPPPPPAPLKRPRAGSAILQAVDKITAETLRFEAKVGEPIRYKGLVIAVHTCEQSAPDEATPDAIAHLTVLSQPEGMAQARQVFQGWMYASSPSAHPFQHSIYDLWLIACRTSAPVSAPAAK
jgi:hypothetical protein